jgi:hypothetical protein
MDFFAGLPILVASLVAVMLFTWLNLERRMIEADLRRYPDSEGAGVPIGALLRANARVRGVWLTSAVAAPLIMAFSGQLDDHGIAHILNDSLQIIAPLTSALFSAAVAWLLVASILLVHATHCRLLARLRCSRLRGEYW